MHLPIRIRGPRLRFKLMLLATALLIVPWLAYLQLIEMERLLIQGQQNAQLLIARGISTVLDNRTDLFDDLSIQFDQFEPLIVHPLKSPIRLDGRSEDWIPEVDSIAQAFPGPATTETTSKDGTFELALGQHAEQLHLYMRVRDNDPVYRGPYEALDTSDHLRLAFREAGGGHIRICTVHYERGGVVTAYRVDESWRFESTGQPIHGFEGVVNETADGVDIEIAMPLSILGDRSGFALSYVDVDNPRNPEIRSVVETVPSSGKEEFNLVLLRSSVLGNIIHGLGYTDSRIMIVDVEQRVRADTGPLETLATSSARDLPDSWGIHLIRPILHRLVAGDTWRELTVKESARIAKEAIASALRGEPSAVRLRSSGDAQIIMATHPIRINDQVLGVVAVEQDIDQILDFERSALEQIALVSLIAFVAVLFLTFAFSFRLAHRIRRLRRQANEAIDESGRLTTDTLNAEVNAGDEIGDLARTIDRMLARLQEHVSFLSRMPRTLRHEINNPLNAVSTSLENLEEATDPKRRDHYLESARRGVHRIAEIVHNLADAANLEESLKAEGSMRPIDIDALLRSYVNNINSLHDDIDYVYRGLDSPARVKVDDYRVEQCMDKLIDNAIDFHRPGTPIKIQLDADGDRVQVSVANRGAPLPKNGTTLFDPMVSVRERQGQMHFGLGLYIVRAIAEFHGGTARAFNLANGSGVVITVRFPREKTENLRIARAQHIEATESQRTEFAVD